MGGDRQFFSDIADGMRSWQDGRKKMIAPGESIRISHDCLVPEDKEYYLQFLCDGKLKTECRGEVWQYGKKPMLRNEISEIELLLAAGKNSIEVTLTNLTDKDCSCEFSARLLDDAGKIVREDYLSKLPAIESVRPAGPEPDLRSFTPATGAAFKSCGRFGYTKGDGILDCSMPYFGILSRPYISGHPNYHKNNLWHFSILPDGERESGSQFETYAPQENETIQNDWTHVRWERKLKSGKFIAYDYSLLTPAVLIETDLDYLSLSKLHGTGGYSTVTLPLESGAVTRECRNGVFYDASKEGNLVRNWGLFSRSGEFPEVPLMLIFRESPRRITAEKNTASEMLSIRVEFDGPLQWAMLEFPFGIKLFQPHELTDTWHGGAVETCSRRHQEALARPVACAEYFKYESESDRMHMVQKFQYKYFTDTLNTQGIPLAVIPPPLAIASPEVPEIELDHRAESLEFPTKYGPLYAVRHSAWSEYFLPVPSANCEFPFPAENSGGLSDSLHSDFDDYMSYHLDAPEVGNPGNYSFVFQYSFAARLFHILKENDRKRLEATICDGLKKVCDPDYEYIGPGGRRCKSWYKRTEPFSGVSYYTTYLHVGGISNYKNCDRETIEHSRLPFVEVDWGNAMSLYGCWLGTLLTNNWDLIRENWHVLRKAFDYYLVMMDWACMTTGYCENAVSWNDGTNYGGYLGFLNLAKLAGKQEDFELARYAYAKMTAMRMGLFHASQCYFYKYFDVQPWRTAKFFHEETDASRAFASYPADIIHNGYREQSLYNMTTEGHYLETWRTYFEYMPDEINILLDKVEGSQPVPPCAPAPDGREMVYHTLDNVLAWQEVFTYLMFCIITKRFEPSTIESMIQQAFDNKRISHEFLGHVIWSKRRVPKHWARCYLLNALHGNNQPHLLAWKNLRISKAAYPILELEVLAPGAWLEFSAEHTAAVELNGKQLSIEPAGKNSLRAIIPESGTFTFKAQQRNPQDAKP